MSENREPVLSVIVPVYNVANYLAECIESILCQDLVDIEIVVVDDGSTDSSAEIIRDYASRDNRIKPYYKENGGLSDARNYGLDRASGKYITFIDSDDVLLSKECFSRIISYLDAHDNIDAVQYDVVYKWKSPYEHKRKYALSEYIGTEKILAGYLKGLIHVSSCDKIFRAEVFNSIRFPKGEISEDIAIISKIATNVRGLYVSDIYGYGYRYREGSISTSVPKPQKIYSILRSYNKYLSLCFKYDSLKKQTIAIYSSLIWNYIAVIRRNYKQCLDEFIEQPVFLNITFADWIKYKDSSIQGALKSFSVCVLGVKYTSKIQTMFIR